MMPKPNLFLIGAMKSGTSSLHSYLAAHPQIFMSQPKEPCYFVAPSQIESAYIRQLELWKDERRYLELFADAGNVSIIGESSTAYTKFPRIPDIPERIAKFNPEARLVYLIRDPVERTISHYWHQVKNQREHRGVLQAIQQVPEYRDVSHYAMQLAPYFEQFDRDRIAICTFEELVANPHAVVAQLLDWLGVDPTFQPPNVTERENATPDVIEQVRGWGLLHQFRHSSVWSLLGPCVPKSIRRLGRNLSTRNVDRRTVQADRVIEFLRPIQQAQTESLRTLLGRDFPEWRTLYGTGDSRENEPAFATTADNYR